MRGGCIYIYIFKFQNGSGDDCTYAERVLRGFMYVCCVMEKDVSW